MGVVQLPLLDWGRGVTPFTLLCLYWFLRCYEGGISISGQSFAGRGRSSRGWRNRPDMLSAPSSTDLGPMGHATHVSPTMNHLPFLFCKYM